jgi:NADH:ubiquinone oxidoreductase subunit 5 (subunit L)/multisubunit Na+/H+ antiporter MnhA subunit
MSALAPYFPTDLLEIIAAFMLIGAVGKSAQVGLHT